MFCVGRILQVSIAWVSGEDGVRLDAAFISLPQMHISVKFSASSYSVRIGTHMLRIFTFVYNLRKLTKVNILTNLCSI